MSDEEIWMRAWIAITNAGKHHANDAPNAADNVLKEFRKRFPLCKTPETR